MRVRTSEEERALARVRWGQRSRLADAALDRLDISQTELAPDQQARLLRIAAGVIDPTDQEKP